jgi:hypothetical protein
MCAVSAAALTACGGGQDDGGSAQADTAAQPLAFELQPPDKDLPVEVATLEALPSFHVAPVLLDEPADTDARDPSASALRAARRQAVPAEMSGLPTQRLSLDDLLAARRMRALSSGTGNSEGTAKPLAGAGTVATYTPAQIRAAYGLPALPAPGATLSPAQAAALGAGQTIYIVAARHNPNAAAELAAFSQKFGLPGCATKAIAATAALPLAAPPAAACEFSQVYATAAATRTATAPAYDAGWATEMALDVQWAHATAPLARIVLVEAVDPTLNSLLGAIKLANAMGPGVVSMSFGAPEGSYTAQVDSAFTVARMSYLAATGDSGASVSWPSVSTNVLAVGGTTLSWAGSGLRGELAWSGTGGGTSATTATPAYQTNAVPGFTGYVRRAVADVAFNADPSSGQYVAVMRPGSSAVNWISAGGTSLATPQWAGLLAVANAQRALAGKAPLGLPHPMLYGQIAAVPGNYAGAFADVLSGRHGSCALCTARIGYDQLTGLGTPNAAGLLSQLSGAAAAAPTPAPAPAPAPVPSPAPAPAKAGPVITATPMTGKVGQVMTGSFSISNPSATSMSVTISGAPAGMGFGVSGLTFTARWPTPVAGSTTLNVTAKNAACQIATASIPVTITR